MTPLDHKTKRNSAFVRREERTMKLSNLVLLIGGFFVSCTNCDDYLLEKLKSKIDPEFAVAAQLSYPISYNHLDNQREQPYFQADFVGALAIQLSMDWRNIVDHQGKFK